MYKVVYYRYGKRKIEEYPTLEEAHRQFNFIGYFGNGFSEYILDENNIIVRDGKIGVTHRKSESKVGLKYEYAG